MIFQIQESDLADLERLLPTLQEMMTPALAAHPEIGPRYRTVVRRVKEILSNVRWNYGPYQDVEIVEPEEPDNGE